MPPRRKTPKRIGRSHTPISSDRKMPSRSPDKAFKTPVPKRRARATKTPGWFSPTEDTFKLPSPNRRVTRRSTVFNIPEFSSLSPCRTRRSSVYPKKVEAPEEGKVKSANSCRSSMMPPKAKPSVSSRRTSVYKKKVNERIADNLTDPKIVKPSSRPPRPSRPAQFSPIKTRRQSMLPKANIQHEKPLVAPKKKVIEALGVASNGTVAAQKAVPAKVGSVQRATKSSAAKAKPNSKSPVIMKRASSTKSLKLRAIRRPAESNETLLVNDLVCLSPKIPKNSPGAMLHKESSDIVLSSRGARTKMASKSATNTELVHLSFDASAKTSKPKTPSRTPSRSQLTKTPSTTGKKRTAGKTSSDTKLSKTPSHIEKRSVEKTSLTYSMAKKAKLDNSVYGTPNFESPHVRLRTITSQIELSASETPEFLTPVGGNQTKSAFRKATPMRPGMENALKMKMTQSSPGLRTMGIRPSATRKTRLATNQMLDQPVIETTVAEVEGGDVLTSEAFNKSDGLDFVVATQIKEPLELDLVKTVEGTKQADSGKCTIL